VANKLRSNNTDRHSSSVTIGNIEGGIHASVIVGRDLIIQIGERTGVQVPQARNLPAQLAALQQALPHLTHSAEKAATQAAIQRLEQAIAALPAHEQAYRERIKARYAEDAPYYVSLAGQTTEAPPAPATPQAPRSARRRRQRAAAEYCEWIQAEKEIIRVKLNTLEEGVAKYPCIILLGDPGSGKTTALEHLAYQLADEPDKLPLPLRLSEFRPGMTLEEFILDGWAGSPQAGHWGAPDLAANLEGYLETGKLFFLFDALNEMPREEYKEHAQALRRFIDQWSPKGNRFLVTCRVLDYGEELSGLQRVEVLPLDDEQIQVFLLNELSSEWEALWGALTKGEDEQHRLLDMARNPYLLTMMIDVYAEDGRLGQSRAELMEHFTRILMEWARAKYPRDEWLEAGVQREALSALAFEMQARAGSGAAVPTSLVRGVMPPQVQIDPCWPSVPSPPDRVLDLAAGAHLLDLPVDRSSVRFYHQLLQEYFAARQMLKRDAAGLAELWSWPWLEKDMPLSARLRADHDPLPPPPPTGWEETTVLAAGLAEENDDQLVRALVQVNPVLAGRCLYEGQAKVGKPIRQAVIDALLQTISKPAIALRVRIAAGEVLGYLGDPRLGEMVVVPAGKFLMGESKEQDELFLLREGKEQQHMLFLPAYRLGKYPVTNAEYGRFIEARGYQDKRWWTKAGWIEKERSGWAEPHSWDNRRVNQPNQPVVGVSWYESMAYCRWLSAESGQVYRLATEAEWEKGARGIDGREYPWGDDFEASRLNADEGAQVVDATTPVGIYPSGVSPYGAFDCAGNVWEWCTTKVHGEWIEPQFKRYPYDASEDEWTETYLKGENMRVLRGGSWCHFRSRARCACRYWNGPDFRYHFIGLRLVSPIRSTGCWIAEILKKKW
jgi:formylglycine-generating enzyme required for sulfatase activity